MKIFAVNGSPRTKWNTAKILQNALEGAASVTENAQTETINLYGLDHYTGCTSCFQCKRLNGPSYGKCAVKDGLKPVLDKVLHADILLIGSPIYYSDVTGMMRCFLERLNFPCFVYDQDYTSIAPKKIHTAFIYTMNVNEELMKKIGYPERLAVMENITGRIFGYKPSTLYVNDTYQFPDYSKYKMEIFKEEDKARRRDEHFPIDCENARKLGSSLTEQALAEAR